jgi:cation:H+ antiporter
MFNLLILAGLDALSGSIPISARVHQGHILTGSFGLLLLGIAAIAVTAGNHIPAIGWIGAETMVFFAVYAIAMRTLFIFERKRIAAFLHHVTEDLRYGSISVRRAYVSYAWNAALVVAAATYLPYIGDQIAQATGLGRTFVGSIFVAVTTSLPELVVSITALRLGSADLVFGNLLGSNLFNIAILAVDDLFYFKAPLLTTAAPGHIVTVSAAIAMTAIALIGVTYQVSKKHFVFAWDSLAIVAVYLYAVTILYMMR